MRPMSQLEEQVRLRIREEMTRKNLSQRDLSGILGGPGKGWSQSRVGKLLTGRVLMGVADMESLCFAVGLSVVEAVRDHGLEFLAEMTPTELRTLERIKQLDDVTRDAYLRILDVKVRTNVPNRYAGKKPTGGRRFRTPKLSR
jgi:transcriptional regulator with XRE-family HTH domain